MKKSKDTRFIIIGAGAAGLTAAETLLDKGYTNVIILEKESFAGGKCRSVEYEGRSYELGAGIISANNKTIMDLVEIYEVPIKPVVFGQDNLFDLETGGVCPDTLSFPDKFSFFWQLLLRYHRLLLQFPKVQEPGLAQCELELFDNFHHWAKMNNIPLVEDKFERFFTGFGYGYWEEVPAAYTLKYNDWASLVSYMRRAIYIFPEGIQGLWKKIADRHKVFYNTSIKRIARKENVITIDTDKQQLRADVLMLTCPLEETFCFMDTTKAEAELFSKIKYTEYITYLCRLENFPNQTGFIPAHFSPSKKGHPVFWYKRYTDTNIYTLYVLSDFTVSDAAMFHNIEECISKLGGSLIKVEQIVKWKYFPHVDTQDMQDGFYPKLESIQGFNNTYYLGELLNFSTVELSAVYAKNLVERFF